MSNLEFELNNHKKDISFIATEEKAENNGMNLHPLVQSTSWNTYMKKINTHMHPKEKYEHAS